MDSITHFVAENTKQLLHLFGVDFRLKEVFQTGFITLFYNQQAVARMIEGCNAVSVIILFAAFIVAFSGKKRTTLIFILAGSFFYLCFKCSSNSFVMFGFVLDSRSRSFAK